MDVVDLTEHKIKKQEEKIKDQQDQIQKQYELALEQIASVDQKKPEI
tara:strand:- start:823 stop:963 length:141 start_codon:yes stop_codon:yes gene_type:complete